MNYCHSNLYCQYWLENLRQDFVCGRSHKVLLDWSIALSSQNDKVDIIGFSAFCDLVADYSFLNQPMNRIILHELMRSQVMQLIFRPGPHSGPGIDKMALMKGELDRRG